MVSVLLLPSLHFSRHRDWSVSARLAKGVSILMGPASVWVSVMCQGQKAFCLSLLATSTSPVAGIDSVATLTAR